LKGGTIKSGDVPERMSNGCRGVPPAAHGTEKEGHFKRGGCRALKVVPDLL